MTFSQDVVQQQAAAALGVTYKFGIVQSVSPLTVRLDGDTSADTPAVSVTGLALVVGDVVWCHHQGTRVVVQGRRRSEGPVVYPITPNTVPGNWADYGNVSFGAVQATVQANGLVVIEGLLKPLVSGTMLTATEYLVASIPTEASPISPRGTLYPGVSAAGPISVRVRGGSIYFTALQSNIPFTSSTWFTISGAYYR